MTPSAPKERGEERVRKKVPYKKSRGGCMVCKRRRIRCDERKPMCSCCLVRGNDCVYPAPSVTWRNAVQQPVVIAPASAPELGLSTQLSATPSDPFDSLSIDMPYASPRLFSVFINYRQRLCTSVPNVTKNTLANDMSEPVWFRACLMLTAGRAFLLCDDAPANFKASVKAGAHVEHRCRLFQAYLHHKAQILPVIRQGMAARSPHSLGIITGPIMCLMLAAYAIGEEVEAMAHLQGLFRIIQIYRSVTGPRSHMIAFRKVPLILLSLLLAARHSITSRERVRWTEVLYLFSHCAIEFRRNRTPAYNNIGFQTDSRLDAPLLHWLLATLEAKRRGGDGLSKQGRLRSPHASADPDEVWIWTKVAGAYALLLGSARPLGAIVADDAGPGSSSFRFDAYDYAAKRPRHVEAYAFMEEMIGKWQIYADAELGTTQMDEGLWHSFVERLDWLETEEGLELVREVCWDMECQHGRVKGCGGGVAEDVGGGHACQTSSVDCLHCPSIQAGLPPARDSQTPPAWVS